MHRVALLVLLLSSVLISALQYPEKSDKPDQQVSCSTTKGSFVLDIYKEWAPIGAERFLQLVEHGYYSDIGLFRVVKDYIVQFGISTDKEQLNWAQSLGQVQDDPSIKGKVFCEGCISFAGGGSNTRGYQAFIAFKDSTWLGRDPWETPFGVVSKGMDVLNSFYNGYGEMAPHGNAPDQGKIYAQGKEYLKTFPLLDYIEHCEVMLNEAEIETNLSAEEDIQVAVESIEMAKDQLVVDLQEDEVKQEEVKEFAEDFDDEGDQDSVDSDVTEESSSSSEGLLWIMVCMCVLLLVVSLSVFQSRRKKTPILPTAVFARKVAME